MGIKVFWDNPEKTIIRVEMEGAWDWDDYAQSIDEAVRLTQEVDHEFHQIIDMRRTRSLPEGSPVPHLLRARATDPDNLGLTVIVGAPKFVEILVTALAKAFGSRFPERLLVETLDEAYELINAPDG